MEDLPIQVCSYRRSGTHLLMKSLYDNFVLPETGKDVDTSKAQMSWYEGEENAVVFVPWIRLFHTHGYPKEVSYDPKKVLYVFRSGKDVLRSYHRSFKITKEFNEWIDERIIKGWYYHLLDWLFAGVYSVCFDDLIHNFDLTMKGIEQRFSLQRKADTFAFPSQKIGWSPSTPDDQPRIWNEESLALYDKIVDWDLILELSSLKGDIND